MLRRQFTRNSAAAAAQVAISSLVLFSVYWYLARTIGIAEIGIWSVVLATTSSSSIANLGIATSTVKFVAKYLAIGNEKRAVMIVETSVSSVGLIIGLFLVVATPIFYHLLQYFIPAENLGIARTILPFAIVSFWINSLASTLQGALDGYHRIDLRSIILILSSFVFLGLVLLLVKQHGLLGLAIAQVVQALVVLALSFFVLRRVLSPDMRLGLTWSKEVFREIINYSLQFQSITVSRMLVEPITKALLSRYGGLAATGYYEMALKLVVQIRSVVVVAYQAFVPAIASLHETRRERIPAVYKKAMEFVLVVIVVILPMIIVSSQLVSQLWLGTINSQFSSFLILTATAWFVNLLSAPAYFINLGTGDLRENIVGHVVTAILNLSLCVILGQTFGAAGVVIGYALSIGIGSLTTTVMYQRRSQTLFTSFFDKPFVTLAVVALASMLVGLSITWFPSGHSPPALVFLVIPLLAYLLLIVRPLWKHPVCNELLSLVRQSIH